MGLISKPSDLVVVVVSPSITKACLSDCKETVHSTVQVFDWLFEFGNFLKTVKCRRRSLNTFPQPVHFSLPRKDDQTVNP